MAETAPADRQAAPGGRVSALDLPAQEYEEAVDLEVAVGSRSEAWVEAELARCFAPDTTSPDRGFRYWAARYWKLVDRAGSVRRLRLLPLQRAYLRRRGDENVVLKYRKGGASTVIDALYYWRCRARPHTHAFVMAHTIDSAAELYRRVTFAHEHMPDFLRAPMRATNARVLDFRDNGSFLRIVTAGGRDAGRAADGDCIHLSEAARYPDLDRVLAAIGEAKRVGAWVDIESTPNGFDRFRTVYLEAREGSGIRRALFFPWWEDPANSLPPVPGHDLLGDDLGELTDEERALRRAHGLTDGQLRFRRWKRADLKHLAPQEFPEDDETCFLVSGNPRFDQQRVAALLREVEQRYRPLPPTDDWPMGDDDGRLHVWSPPEEGRRYVVGADVAEGVPGGAYSVAAVLDQETGEQCAEWRGHVDPFDFGRRVLATLGRWYNTALVAPERNNHGHSTIAGLREAGYPAIYRHRSAAGGRRRRGWPTDGQTKPVMIDELDTALREGWMGVRSARFLRECLSFQYGDEDRDGRVPDPGRPLTRWSDCVIAWAIAWQVRKRGVPGVA